MKLHARTLLLSTALSLAFLPAHLYAQTSTGDVVAQATQVQVDADGNPVLDENGNPVLIAPEAPAVTEEAPAPAPPEQPAVEAPVEQPTEAPAADTATPEAPAAPEAPALTEEARTAVEETPAVTGEVPAATNETPAAPVEAEPAAPVVENEPAAEEKTEENTAEPAQSEAAPAAPETNTGEAKTDETVDGTAKPKKRKAKDAAEAAPVEQAAPAAAETAPAATEAAPAARAAKTATPANTATAPEAPAPATPAAAAGIVSDDATAAQKAAEAVADKQRRADKRKRRNELIGAAAAGAVVGAVINELGGRVVGDEGDRVIVESEGEYFLRKDENERLRENGARVTDEVLPNGNSRTIATRPNGVQVITVRDSGGFILRRVRVLPNGERVVLIDNLNDNAELVQEPVRALPRFRLDIPQEDYVVETGRADRQRLRETLQAQPVETVERAYTLRQVRENERLRAKVRRVDLDTLTFESGSFRLTQSQVDNLENVGESIASLVEDNPGEVFLVEGHTDAVGDEISNLTLSDRRAETIARVLTLRYGVPPENLIVQGYGEQFLKVATQGAEQANRRVTVRRITPLLASR